MTCITKKNITISNFMIKENINDAKIIIKIEFFEKLIS